jgi:hypothetical protein
MNISFLDGVEVTEFVPVLASKNVAGGETKRTNRRVVPRLSAPSKALQTVLGCGNEFTRTKIAMDYSLPLESRFCSSLFAR